MSRVVFYLIKCEDYLMVQNQSLNLVLERYELVSVLLRDLRWYSWQFLAVCHPP